MKKLFKFFITSFNNWHLHRIIQTFSNNLINIFIPIYLLKIGFSLKTIFLYYIIYSIFYSITSLFTIFIKKIGFKIILIIYPFFEIINYLWIYLLTIIPQTIYLNAIFTSLISFYWVSYDFLFSKISKKNIQAAVGNMSSFPTIITLFSPIIGGLIIKFYSFKLLFLIVSILLLISIIPLLKIKNINIKPKCDFKKIFNKNYIKYIYGFIAEGVYYSLILTLIPINIFLLFNKTLNLGIFSTIIKISNFIFPLIITYYSKDRINKFIKIGALLQLIILSTFFLLTNQLSYLIFGFIINFTFIFWHLPFQIKIYKYINKTKSFEFTIFKGIIINLSYSIPFLIMYLFNNLNLIYYIELIIQSILIFL